MLKSKSPSPSTTEVSSDTEVHAEYCQYTITSIKEVDYLSQLTSLCIIAQDIQEIDGLDECTGLESLWICETEVRCISNLGMCTSLKNLYLYGNKITKIEGLENLVGLRTLWLSDNRIKTIENISHLKSLQELNLANNLIQRVGNEMSLLSLNSLNLAGNPIQSLLQVKLLGHLNLRILALSDPNYPPSPIVEIKNYHVFILTYLPHLELLDQITVTKEMMEKIESFVREKSIFYGMKINYIISNIDTTIGQYQLILKTQLETLSQYTHAYTAAIPFCNRNPEHRDKLELLTKNSLSTQSLLEHLLYLSAYYNDYLRFTKNWWTKILALEFTSCGNFHLYTVPNVPHIQLLIEQLVHKMPKLSLDCFLGVQMSEEASKVLLEENVFKSYIPVAYEVSSIDDIFSEVMSPELNDDGAINSEKCFLKDNETPSSNLIFRYLVVCIVEISKLQKVQNADQLQTKPLESKYSGYYSQHDNIYKYNIRNKSAILPVGMIVFHEGEKGQQVFPPNSQSVFIDAELTRKSNLNRSFNLVDSAITQLNPKGIIPDMQKDNLDSFLQSKRRDSTEIDVTVYSSKNMYAVTNALPAIISYMALEKLYLRGLYLDEHFLDRLVTIKRLKFLDLSFCNFSAVPKVVNQLKHLDTFIFQGNLIQEVRHLTPKDTICEQIKEIDFRMNPITLHRSYGKIIRRHYPNLTLHDGQPAHTVTVKLSREIICPEHEKYLPLTFCLNLDGEEFMIEPLKFNEISFLTCLILDNCHIMDLNFLKTDLVKHVKSASFMRNLISDTAPLINLSNIQELSLQNNRIEILTGIETLDKLRRLNVGHNDIYKIDIQEQHPALEYLNIDCNKLNNLLFLEKMTNLTELFVSHNPIQEMNTFRILKDLVQLHVFSASEPIVNDDEKQLHYVIHHNSTVKYFNGILITDELRNRAQTLYGGKFTLHDLLEKIGSVTLANIREVDLQNCKLKKLDCFVTDGHRLVGLKKLNLVNNELTCADDLMTLSNLSHLNMSNNWVKKLLSDCSGGLANLEYLGLANNFIADLGDVCFERMPALRILHLHSNLITKIENLWSYNLNELVLNGNQIREVEKGAFEHTPKIAFLWLSDNRIKFLSVGCMPALQTLHLDQNRLQDLSELEGFNAPLLKELYLGSNPIVRTKFYRSRLLIIYPTLYTIDSTIITDSERERAQFLSDEMSVDSHLTQSLNSSSSQLVVVQPTLKVAMKVKVTTLGDSLSEKLIYRPK